MLLRFLFLIFIFLVLAFGYLSYHNTTQVTFSLSQQMRYQLPIVQLVFISFFSGGVVVFISYMAYDLRKALEKWRIRRREKKRGVVQELYQQGVDALKRGDREKAKDFLTRYIEKDPTNIEAYIQLAGIYSKEESYGDAIKVLSKARLMEPNHTALLFNLARDFKRAQKLDDAINTLENIIDIAPSNLEALRDLRDIYRSVKRWEDACDAQKEIIRYTTRDRKKSDQEVKILLGFKYEYGNQLLEAGEVGKAEKVFKELIKQDKGFTPSYIGLGDAYYKEGKLEEATNTWEKAFASSGDIVFLHRLEDMLIREEQPDRILEGYRNILAERPDGITVRFFYGKLCLRLEMVEEALDQLQRVEASGAEFPEIHFLLAEAYRRRGRYRESVDEFRKALSFKRMMVIPFVCSNCGKEFIKWSGCCPECGMCNTFSLPFQQRIAEMEREQVLEMGRA
jgi:tetratricopeptide (TPR) repeat protein